MKRGEQEQRLALARRMRRAGIPLDIPEDDTPVSFRSEVGLVIRCIRGEAVQLNPYFSAFHIFVKIISNRTVPFHIDDFGLELPWPPKTLWLLPDPAEEDPARSAYKFGGMVSWSFPRREVLNHLRNHSFELKRGRPLEGYLLWLAEGEIPKEFSSKAPIPTMVSVVDQYGFAYNAGAPFIVKRLRSTRVSRTGRNITGRADFENAVCEAQQSGPVCNSGLNANGPQPVVCTTGQDLTSANEQKCWSVANNQSGTQR